MSILSIKTLQSPKSVGIPRKKNDSGNRKVSAASRGCSIVSRALTELAQRGYRDKKETRVETKCIHSQLDDLAAAKHFANTTSTVIIDLRVFPPNESRLSRGKRQTIIGSPGAISTSIYVFRCPFNCDDKL